MWKISLIIIIFLALGPGVRTAWSQTTLQAPLSDSLKSDQAGGKWGVGLYLEIRSRHQDLERPISRSQNSLQDLEISLTGKVDQRTSVLISAASEPGNIGTPIYLKEAFAIYRPASRRIVLNMGQKLMSIGLLNEREHIFSSNPDFYRKIWTTHKGIDLGIEMEIYPWKTPLFYLKGALYSGQLIRPGDERLSPPDEQPRELSLRSRSEYHEAFISRFDQHLALLDPITAYGGGLVAQTRHLLPAPLELHFFGEIWDINERQLKGPDQNTLGYFVFPSIQWKSLRLGYRYSETHSSVGAGPTRVDLVPGSGRLLRAEIQLTPALQLMAEKILESDSQITRDETVVRGILNWSFE